METDDNSGAWGEANDKVDKLIDSFNKALASKLDGAQDVVDKLIAELRSCKKLEIDADTRHGGETTGEKEHPDWQQEQEYRIEDASQALVMRLMDAYKLPDKFLEQSIEIVEQAQCGEKHTDNERELSYKCRHKIDETSAMMRVAVEDKMNALTEAVRPLHTVSGERAEAGHSWGFVW